MSESALKEVEKEKEVTQTTNEQSPVSYDASAKNRFDFSVKYGDEHYDTAHIFKPLSDERYLQWVDEINKIDASEDGGESQLAASVKLWDELIDSVENIDYDPGEDWKSMISSEEKNAALIKFLTVAINKKSTAGKRKLQKPGEQTTTAIRTDAWFNSEVATQEHVLKARTREYEKKYAAIQKKRFRPEPTRGLRRDPKILYFPQDKLLGELYDEMSISSSGFAGDVVPLRFKTTVIHHMFESGIDEKKPD